jgi:hypothetical protein
MTTMNTNTNNVVNAEVLEQYELPVSKDDLSAVLAILAEMRVINTVTYDEAGNPKLVMQLTESQAEALNKKMRIAGFKYGVSKVIGAIVSSAATVIDFTAKNIVAPTIKQGVRLGVSAVKTGAETGVLIGAQTIISLVHGVNDGKKFFKENPDCQEAKRHLKAFGKALLGMVGSSTSGGLKKI